MSVAPSASILLDTLCAVGSPDALVFVCGVSSHKSSRGRERVSAAKGKKGTLEQGEKEGGGETAPMQSSNFHRPSEQERGFKGPEVFPSVQRPVCVWDRIDQALAETRRRGGRAGKEGEGDLSKVAPSALRVVDAQAALLEGVAVAGRGGSGKEDDGKRKGDEKQTHPLHSLCVSRGRPGWMAGWLID